MVARQERCCQTGWDRRVYMFLEKMPYTRKACNTRLVVLSDSDINASKYGCFCKPVGCIRVVVPKVKNILCCFPQFYEVGDPSFAVFLSFK